MVRRSSVSTPCLYGEKRPSLPTATARLSQWTEALTLITEGRAPDEVYAEARKEFGEEELVNLSLAIITINGWNRLAIGFRKIPGEYQPHKIG
jgi:alkylhydroperoxidase family enzyme